MTTLLAEMLKEKRDCVYRTCNNRQDLDCISFKNYPIDMHNKLFEFYSEVEDMFVANGFWETLLKLNEKIVDPSKTFYSDIESLPFKRMLSKWSEIIDGSSKNNELIQMFLVDNWLNEDFYPFLPKEAAPSFLMSTDKRIICRLSSTKELCISFTYFRNQSIKNLRMVFDANNSCIVPEWSSNDEKYDHPLTGKSIAEVKSNIEMYL